MSVFKRSFLKLPAIGCLVEKMFMCQFDLGGVETELAFRGNR